MRVFDLEMCHSIHVLGGHLRHVVGLHVDCGPIAREQHLTMLWSLAFRQIQELDAQGMEGEAKLPSPLRGDLSRRCVGR